MVLAVSGALSTLYYRDSVRYTTNAALERLSAASVATGINVTNAFGNIADVLRIAASSDAVEHIVRQDGPKPPTSMGPRDSQGRDALALFFKAMLSANPSFTQLRLIGVADQGREIVRVDQTSKGVVRIPEGRLQQKGQRPYFEAALEHQWAKGVADKKNANQVLFTDVSYNREHGQISYPPTLTLRVIKPVFSSDGSLFGFLIANVDYLRLMKRISNDLAVSGSFYIIYSNGEYFEFSGSGSVLNLRLAGATAQISSSVVDEVLAQMPAEGSIQRSDSISHYVSVDLPATPSGQPIKVMLQVPRTALLADVNQTARKNGLLLLVLSLAAIAVYAQSLSH
jgi:hypothetical protein